MSLDLSQMTDDQLKALYQQQQSIHQIESNGAPDTAAVVNPASGARGSMQVMDKTAKDPGFGVKPSNGSREDDARMGRDYYAALSQKYDGDPLKTAVAYNWGPGNADKWIASGAKLSDLPNETLKYLNDHGQNIGLGAATAAPQQKPQQQLPQPTKTEMNIVEEAPADTADYTPLGRVQQGVMDTLGGGARAGLKGLGWLLGKAGDKQGEASMNDTVQQAEEAQAARDREFALKAQQAGAQPGSTDWYRLGGKMIPGFLVPSGAATTLGGAALQGAAGGALLGAADTPPGDSYLANAGKGAAFGGAGGAAVNVLGKIIGGARINPRAQELIDQGVTPTPGQVFGGAVNRYEEKAEIVPILGDAVMAARRGAVEDVNRSLYRQTLEPLGQNFANQAPRTVGREAVEQVHRTISNQYDNLFPHLNVNMDAQFVQDLGGISQQAQRYLNADDLRTFNNTVQDTMLGTMTRAGANGTVSGKELKDIETALGQEITRYSGPNATVAEGRIADALTSVQEALRSAMMRQNPAMAQELQRINTAWSRYAILRNAANRVTNPGEPIKPGQLQAAIRQESKQVSKSAFGEGRANMQGLGDATMDVLADKYPNSGTAGRMALGVLTAGGLGAINPGALGGILAGSGLYGTRLGRQAMLAAIARRPEFARQLGGGLEAISPYAGVLAGGLPTQQQK